MNVPQDQLDRWRRMAGGVSAELNAAALTLRPPARDHVVAASNATRRLALDLEDAGAQRPAELRPRPETPLHLLDTPANRRYLELLRAAWEAGLAVDRERYGADIGTDGCAQAVEMILADVETEIHGPAGRVRNENQQNENQQNDWPRPRRGCPGCPGRPRPVSAEDTAAGSTARAGGGYTREAGTGHRA